MNWASIFVGCVLPGALGGAGGYAVGKNRANVVGLVLHVFFGCATFLVWALMENAPGWDGIVFLLILIPLGICWLAFCVAHFIGYVLSR